MVCPRPPSEFMAKVTFELENLLVHSFFSLVQSTSHSDRAMALHLNPPLHLEKQNRVQY